MASGASKQETEAQASEQAIAKQLQANYTALFGQQQGILTQLNKALQPLINGTGLNVEGYSPEALAAMRTSATDTTAASFQNAQKALQAKEQASGLTDALPSGVTLAQAAGLQSQGAEAQSQAQNQITIENYQQGVKNYLAGIQSLGGEASLLGGEATGTAGAANSAGQAAFTEANTMASQGFSLSKLLGGVLGGALSLIPGLGPVGPMLGGAVSSAFGAAPPAPVAPRSPQTYTAMPYIPSASPAPPTFLPNNPAPMAPPSNLNPLPPGRPPVFSNPVIGPAPGV